MKKLVSVMKLKDTLLMTSLSLSSICKSCGSGSEARYPSFKMILSCSLSFRITLLESLHVNLAVLFAVLFAVLYTIVDDESGPVSSSPLEEEEWDPVAALWCSRDGRWGSCHDFWRIKNPSVRCNRSSCSRIAALVIG